MKGKPYYGLITIIMVIVILIQPLRPLGFSLARPGRVSGWSEPGPAAEAQPQLAVQGNCHVLYLPAIHNAGQSGTGAFPTNSNKVGQLAGPDFKIISPAQGWTISGIMYFAVQPVGGAPIDSVSFKAGATDLGTDTTPGNGLRAFLDADDFPAGPLQLSATASNVCGETTKSVTVTVEAAPPQSGTIGSAGGVLASQIGSIITVPPGAVPDGTDISVTELSQQEVTDRTGIQWEDMGVTFLGAQDIQSTSSFSLPLGVASAGFGNRVQPGQAVVNYRIIPDADGDGVDEIVVVNTASVAPNNDVISDPIPQVVLDPTATTSNSNGFVVQQLEDGIGSPPGTIIKLEVEGFNLYSVLGNVAVFSSTVGGLTVEVPGTINRNHGEGLDQVFSVATPLLPAGPAELVLSNKSTGYSSEAISLTITSPTPLSRPAIEVINDYFDQFSALLADLQAVTSDQIDTIDEMISAVAQLKAEFETLSKDTSPEIQQFLEEFALLIENSGVLASAINSKFDSANNCVPQEEVDEVQQNLDLVKEVYKKALFFPGLKDIGGLVIDLMVGGVKLLVDQLPVCDDNAPEPCSPSQNPDGNPNPMTGMGAAPPSGGNGCGGAASGEGNGQSIGTSLSNQHAGSIIVKLYSAGFPLPFSGMVDPGGYFYIPLIPEGEPFIAIAFDTHTGQTRTAQGVGPPIGESVFMFFNFISGPDATVLPYHQVITGSIEFSSETDIYSLSGDIGDEVLLRMARTSGALDPQFEVLKPDTTTLCSAQSSSSLAETTCSITITDTHNVLVKDWGNTDTGDYELFLLKLNDPAPTIPISYNQLLTGTVAAGAAVDVYSFTGTISDVVRISMSRVSGGIDPQLQVYRRDGTFLCGQSTSGATAQADCFLDVPESYSIVVSDRQADESGDYNLYIQKLNDPADNYPITFGQVVTGVIAPGPELDVYTFTGAISDVVRIRMNRLSGGLDPQFEVVQPGGSVLCSASTSSALAEVDCGLSASGTYTLFVSDAGADEIGSYGLYLQRLNEPEGFTAIDYGLVVSGTIDQSVLMHTYVFSGTAGDVVRVSMNRLSGSLDPLFEVFRPDGSRLCNNQSTSGQIQRDCTLDASGVHTLLLGDWGADEIGDYQLYLQRLNDPADFIPISYGELVSGTIDLPVLMHTYIFSGTAGDVVRVSMNRLAGGLDPLFEVFRPDGTGLCNNQSTSGQIQRDCTLDASGTHTVLLGDWGADEIGDYQLYLQRLNDPADFIAISYGELVSGTIDLPVLMHTYIFSGTAGDVVRVSMNRLSGSLDPLFEAFRPDGSRLCNNQSTGGQIQRDCTLDASGVHTILLGDWGADETGDYQLYLQRLNDPADFIPISYGELVSGTIDLPVLMHTYIFSGTAGDVVRVSMNRLAGGLDPLFEVFRPDGTGLCNNQSTSGQIQRDCTLDASGTHTILLGDWGADEIGDYQLYLQRLNDPADYIAISYGELVSGTIDLPVLMHTYVFSGTAGDVVRVSMNRLAGGLDPLFEVFRPDGSRLCNNQSTSSQIQRDCTLDASGAHTILLGDWGADEIGDYQLYLQRLNDPADYIPISYGETLTGTIDPAVAVNVYSFTGTISDSLTISVTLVGGTLDPSFAIYRPDGSLLCNGATSGSIIVRTCELDVSGEHLIYIADFGANDTGSYKLFIDETTAPAGQATQPAAARSPGRPGVMSRR